MRSPDHGYERPGDEVLLVLARVPNVLHELVAYAQLWGIADDYDRDTLVDNAPITSVRGIVRWMSCSVLHRGAQYRSETAHDCL